MPQPATREVDVVVVGAGAAGLALACLLGEQGDHRVVLVEAPPGPARSPARTWCSWHVGDTDWEEAVSARWSRAAVHSPQGGAATYDLEPFRYSMIRSRDYERVAGERLARTGVDRVEALVSGISPDGTVVGAGVRGRWVFDTRPTPPAEPGRTALLQHFKGWFVRTATDRFDPDVVGLMDFRPPQPTGGVAFGYVLPTSPREALVEYTEFSRAVLPDEAYESALNDWTCGQLELGSFEVTGAEQGAIPMTDAPFPRRVGERVFRLGAAGGATRPSTGYTFSGAQRQARAVAAALGQSRDPEPPPAYGRRALALDAVMLRAIDSGALNGAAFFASLFARQPTDRVLRFLDGTTSLREDLAVMAAAPRGPMLQAVLRR